jgi:hypothetical protein
LTGLNVHKPGVSTWIQNLNAVFATSVTSANPALTAQNIPHSVTLRMGREIKQQSKAPFNRVV